VDLETKEDRLFYYCLIWVTPYEWEDIYNDPSTTQRQKQIIRKAKNDFYYNRSECYATYFYLAALLDK